MRILKLMLNKMPPRAKYSRAGKCCTGSSSAQVRMNQRPASTKAGTQGQDCNAVQAGLRGKVKGDEDV